jgi:hypothetical protein
MPKLPKVNTDSEELPDAPQEILSPPGMVMRSGRKKRRRSKETSGLTPDEIAKTKRNRATDDDQKETDESEETESGNDLDKQDDEEMVDDLAEDTEVEEGEAEDKPVQEVPVQVTTASVATSSVAGIAESDVGEKSIKISPIRNLRLPSEQTPGKHVVPAKPLDTPYDHRYHGRIALGELQQVQEPPVVARISDPEVESQDHTLPEEPRLSTPVRRLFRTIQTTIKDIMVPNAADLDLDDDEVSEHSSFLFRPHFWFVVIVVLQGLCFQYYLNPVLTTMYEFSGHSVLWYKNLIGVQPTVIKNITEVEVVISVPSPPKKVIKVVEQEVVVDKVSDNPEVGKLVEELASAKSELMEAVTTMEKAKNDINKELDLVKLTLMTKEASLRAWDAALSKAEEGISELLNVPPSDIPDVAQEREIAGDLKKLEEAALMEIDTEIVTSEIPMWKVVSSSGCPQPLSNEYDPLVTDSQVLQAARSLNQAAQDTVREIIQDPEIEESVKEWVQEELETIPIEDATSEVSEVEDVGLLIGVTEHDAKKMIDERLEAALGDSAGLLDVVARYNGAEIVRRGPRATTPSLVQSLPLVNRLMAAAKLRFYGHGPYAALTPTIPPDALGQCWSFENIARSKNPRWSGVYKRDNANGKYATLTIKLAKPTTIKRVLIEHNAAPAKKDSSAIMDFRVIGYVDPSASGSPIHLGVFRYDKDGASSQQYQISKAHDELQSITLAIDSVYSKDVACLYRFRVLEN